MSLMRTSFLPSQMCFDNACSALADLRFDSLGQKELCLFTDLSQKQLACP